MVILRKLFILFIVLSLTVLTSCQEEEFGYNAFEIAYKTNFEKQYGKIKPDQIWDFSSYNLRKLGLVGGPAHAGMTRTQGVDEPYSLDKIVLYPNNKQMPGFDPSGSTGNNNSNTANGIGSYGQGGNLTYKYDDLHKWLGTQPAGEGDRIVFQKPTAGFTVIPFNDKASDNAIGPWELHLVDMGGPGDGFDYKITDSSHPNGPIVIKPQYITGNFYFYIKFKGDSDDNLAIFTGASSSVTHVIDGNPSLVLGCECGVGSTDYKDLGILIMVPQKQIVPPVKPEDPPTLHIITDDSKKYMIEDRGSTADFDFNDIVVVVRHYKDVDISGKTPTVEFTRAKLVYLCGTIPFSLTIGGQSFGEMQGQVEYVPTVADGYGDLASENGADITDQTTLDQNNIQVTVANGSAGTMTYAFPESGTMPLMIAVDPSVTCSPENESVSRDWFQTYVKNQQTVVVVNEQ